MSDSDEQKVSEREPAVRSGRWVRIVPIAVFISLCVLFYLSLDHDPQTLPSVLVGRTLPDVELPSLADPAKTHHAADFLGKPFLINIWATWCPSCRVEHPTLLRLSQAGVPILGVNYKDVREDALVYLKRYRDPFAWSVFDEAGSWGFELGVYGAPETFFVDADGTIVYRHVGVITEQVWRNELSERYQAMGGERVDLSTVDSAKAVSAPGEEG
ncbi:MAG: DsbE family thiol:disulfide interchange protein [Gammaproteobacteria bacterium]